MPTTAKELKPGEGKIATDAIEVKVDPRAEWKQIFDEAWRINRDYFYDPNMHGVDWRPRATKYARVPAARHHARATSTASCSGCSASWPSATPHHGAGERLSEPRPCPAGCSARTTRSTNGRYRFKKVYGGLNWTPQLRAPLTEPGVNVKAGEYLLAVNGKDLRPPTKLFSLFENTAGKIVEITVGPNADGTGSRTVQVVPIANEAGAAQPRLGRGEPAEGRQGDRRPGRVRLRAEHRRRRGTRTSSATSSRRRTRTRSSSTSASTAAARSPTTTSTSCAGRSSATGRCATARTSRRRRPSIQGPKVMIIDETAGSGGDLLPWMFRKFKLGPIVGKRTWGGLVGILGFPVLMDGGGVTAPNLAIWTEDGWVVENEGVPPDIEVEQTPADVIAGRDPQLEKAIELALDALKKNPPKTPARPPYKKAVGR